MLTANVINRLNSLIQSCRDDVAAYRLAAERVNNPELQPVFESFANERESYITDLTPLIEQLGGKPDDNTTLGGTLRRGWMNLKSALAGGGEDAILAECLRAETTTMRDYSDAMGEGLPDPIYSVVRAQYQEILAVRDRLMHLREGDAQPS